MVELRKMLGDAISSVFACRPMWRYRICVRLCEC